MSRSARAIGWALFLLCMGSVGCAEQTPKLESNRSDSESTMPPALRAAWIQQVQNEAGAKYAIANVKDRRFEFEARHPKQNLRTRFNAESVELSDRDGGAPLRLALTQVNGLDPGAGRLEREGNKVTVHRPEMDEWYVHGPMGLEQGFTIPEPLPTTGADDGVLRLAMAVEGDFRPSKRGEVIVWRGDGRALETRELFAFDADGKQLAASMRASRTELTIEVHTARARYPIVIDPLWVEQQKLVAATATSTGWFGHSVSMSGNTAVIGMPRDGTNGLDSGSAHVFVWNGTGWENQQVLRASDPAAGDEFGVSVSLDGDTILVGSVHDDDNGAGSGSAYVFVGDKGVWTEQQKLVPPDGGAGDQFGVSVSLDGDTALIGAPNDDDVAGDAGAAYVFVRSGAVWVEEQKLFGWNSDGDDYFGSAVSVDGDTSIVGTPNDDDHGGGSGAAFVFVRTGTVWSGQQKLTASDGSGDDGFAHSVVIEGDTAVVGAPFDDDRGADSGSAYVFVRSGAVWSQQRKLVASDGMADDEFGFSLDISGESLVIGAHRDDESALDVGSAFVFVRSGTVWTEQQKLRSSSIPGFHFGTSVSISGDAIIGGAPKQYVPGIAYAYRRSGAVWTADEKIGPIGSGLSDQRFGEAVGLSGDTAVVGAPRFDGWSSPLEGAVYVFIRSGTSWSEQQDLRASDRYNSDQFGTAVGVDGDTIIVGAPYDDDFGISSGAAYVFVRSGSVWTEQQKLLPPDGGTDQRFGSAVAVDGDTALVGALQDDDAGSRSGSVYAFVRSGSTWTQQDKLLAPDGAINDYFGYSLALEGDTGAVGAPGHDATGADSGAVYVFTRSGATWSVEQKIVPADNAPGDWLGAAVSLSGDTLALGAPYDDSNLTDAGSVYVFTRSAGAWTEQQEVFPSDALSDARIGLTLGVDAHTLLIGAPRDEESGVNAGAAYVFTRSGSVWTEVGKVLAPDAEELDELGWSVALSGETALVGAPGDDDRGPGGGAAYAFFLMLENGDACFTNGQCLSDLCDPVDLVCACVDAADCSIGEVCDTNEAPNACEPVDTCGNGTVETGEACDDGSVVSGDGCSASCFVDDQGNGSDCTNGGDAACASGVCDATETPDTCEPAGTCGNSVVEGGEGCDDGHVESGDGCSSACFVDDLPNGADCSADGAAACASGVCDSTETPATCEPAGVCGNGAIEGNEVCDDGNTASGDGCDPQCLLDISAGPCTRGSQCGSGVCNTLARSAVCARALTCGNGLFENGEACDDGNQVSGDGCSQSCTLENGWRGGAGCSVGTKGPSGGPVWLFGLLALLIVRPRRHLQSS